MTGLGEFLERFFGPHEFFRTVHARVHHTMTASPRSSSAGRRPLIGRRRRDTEPRSESSKHLIFWAHLPDKVRVETTWEEEGRNPTTVQVVSGDTKWQRHADGTVEQGSNRRRGGEICSLPTEFQRHFDRGLLRQCFAALTLELIGTCRVAGRECLTIRARHVPGTQLWPHWLSFHTNEFEFAADVEYAVLLTIKGIENQATVESHEVLEVEFDGKIDPSYFTYEPGVNEIVQPATLVSEHMTIEAAAIRAPFVVLQPGYTPSSGHTGFEVIYHPRRLSRNLESLTILYRGADSYDRLWIDQRCEPDERQQRELEWNKLLVDGQRMLISDPHPEEGLRVLSRRCYNTVVTIISDLPTDELVKIALSLTPVCEQDDIV